MSLKDDSGKPPKKSAAEKRRIQDEKNRSESQQYLLAKSHVLKKEKENFTKLAFVRNRSGWYKGFDHTAIIFSHDIAPKIGVKAQFSADRDYNNPAKYGFVSIPNIEKVTSLLSGLGIKQEYNKDGIVVFRLVEKYTEDDIQRILEEERGLVENANKLTMPKVIMPALKQRLQALAKSVYETVRKMPAPAREAFGTDMARESAKLVTDFFLMANGNIDKEEYFRLANESIVKINAMLMLVLNINAMSPKRVVRIMEFLNSAKAQLESSMKRSTKNATTN